MVINLRGLLLIQSVILSIRMAEAVEATVSGQVTLSNPSYCRDVDGTATINVNASPPPVVNNEALRSSALQFTYSWTLEGVEIRAFGPTSQQSDSVTFSNPTIGEKTLAVSVTVTGTATYDPPVGTLPVTGSGNFQSDFHVVDLLKVVASGGGDSADSLLADPENSLITTTDPTENLSIEAKFDPDVSTTPAGFSWEVKRLDPSGQQIPAFEQVAITELPRAVAGTYQMTAKCGTQGTAQTVFLEIYATSFKHCSFCTVDQLHEITCVDMEQEIKLTIEGPKPGKDFRVFFTDKKIKLATGAGAPFKDEIIITAPVTDLSVPIKPDKLGETTLNVKRNVRRPTLNLLKDDPATARDERKTVVVQAIIQTIDSPFAPSIERLDFSYTVNPNNFAAPFAKIEIFKKDELTNPIFKDESIRASGFYFQDGERGWDGKADQGADAGKYVGPAHSPLTVRLTISSDSTFAHPCSAEKETFVEIESILINKTTDEKVFMNDPENTVLLEGTVKLKKKNNTGAITAVPVEVTWTFADPKDDNAVKNDSFEYETGKFLGKDANDVHWSQADPQSPTTSPDQFKQTAKSTTITQAGTDQGKAKIFFKPSGVGADDFRVTASAPPSGKQARVFSAQTGTLTVWRSVTFNNVFEMQGESHVATRGTDGNIQPFFDPGFVKVSIGGVQAIPGGANLTVKYIGLWDPNLPGRQQDWSLIQKKKNVEEPSEQEFAIAADPDHPDQAEAREKIRIKAQAWADRIETGFFNAFGAWVRDSGIPIQSAIGIKYFHPKFNAGGGESVTDEWRIQETKKWLRVTFTLGNGRVHPDLLWAELDALKVAGGRGFLVATGIKAEREKVVITHEIGHVTGDPGGFHRAFFGPGDHSSRAGLMDPFGSQPQFSAEELSILRGLKAP